MQCNAMKIAMYSFGYIHPNEIKPLSTVKLRFNGPDAGSDLITVMLSSTLISNLFKYNKIMFINLPKNAPAVFVANDAFVNSHCKSI